MNHLHNAIMQTACYFTVEVENARYPFPIMVAIHVKPKMKEREFFDSI